jgi:hypothetical protein
VSQVEKELYFFMRENLLFFPKWSIGSELKNSTLYKLSMISRRSTGIGYLQ